MLTVEAETKSSSNNLRMDAKAPAVLQVLPRLETGGVERGTVDITAALIAAGRSWEAPVPVPQSSSVSRAQDTGLSHQPATCRRGLRI